MIGIRGRLISAALYQEVHGGSWRKSCDVGFVSSSSSSGLILVACPETVQCRSTPDPASCRDWVDRCLPTSPGLCCPAVLLISALDALRSSFEENSVAECGLFYRVAIWNT